ncbi:MAG TPA: phosphoribosylanthranilate isomerase [Kiritimatiellia bacterium]|jgi:phosphoribosylanthranilate isomerase
MGIFVKICGIASAADAVSVAALRPDAMGFILWPGSKRAVTADDVAAWVPGLPKSILKVGVFVNPTPAQVARDVARAGLDIAQIQGAEDASRFNDLSIRLWKTAYTEKDSTASLAAWHVDAVHLDTYSKETPGGTGRVGDWNAARKFVLTCSQRVILAGGLTPDNVADAVREVGPWGVDVSSGVEEKPGKKDLARVRAFIEACRSL